MTDPYESPLEQQHCPICQRLFCICDEPKDPHGPRPKKHCLTCDRLFCICNGAPPEKGPPLKVQCEEHNLFNCEHPRCLYQGIRIGNEKKKMGRPRKMLGPKRAVMIPKVENVINIPEKTEKPGGMMRFLVECARGSAPARVPPAYQEESQEMQDGMQYAQDLGLVEYKDGIWNLKPSGWKFLSLKIDKYTIAVYKNLIASTSRPLVSITPHVLIEENTREKCRVCGGPCWSGRAEEDPRRRFCSSHGPRWWSSKRRMTIDQAARFRGRPA